MKILKEEYDAHRNKMKGLIRDEGGSISELGVLSFYLDKLNDKMDKIIELLESLSPENKSSGLELC